MWLYKIYTFFLPVEKEMELMGLFKEKLALIFYMW